MHTIHATPNNSLLASREMRGGKATQGRQGDARKGTRPDSLKHIPRNIRDPTHCRLARQARRLLQTRLDGVNGSIGEGAHGAGDEADDGGLVGGDRRVGVLGLPFLQQVFEFRVGSEVHCLIGSWGCVLASVCFLSCLSYGVPVI